MGDSPLDPRLQRVTNGAEPNALLLKPDRATEPILDQVAAEPVG
jgi:hypothetical protein